MEILFLGTGAADFSEELNKNHSFGLNDKSVRKSASVLIDGKILVDCGPHTFSALSLYNVDISKIKALLITHFHSDHFNRQNVESILRLIPDIKIVYSKQATPFFKNERNAYPVNAYEPFCLAEYTITPLNANHTENPLHYLIQNETGKSFLYATDGAWMLNDTFNFLRGKYLNAVAIDCTVGDYEGDFRMSEHNSLPMIRMMEKSLRTVNVLSDKTQIILTHIARTLNKPYLEMQSIADKNGYTVAYDGMTVKI